MLVCAYFAVGFFPFELEPPTYVKNSATPIEAGGISFPGPGMARTSSPPTLLSEVINGSPLRVRLRFRPERADQRGPARILTISSDYWMRNLTIGQDGEDLIVRLRRSDSDLNGMPPFRVPDMLGDLNWHHLELSVEKDKVTIVADGVERVRTPIGSARLENWSTKFNLALGNEVIGGRQWLGEITLALVEVGENTYRYSDPGALELPQGWWEVPPRLHDIAGLKRIAQSDGLDVLINLLGFVPLGAYVAWHSNGHTKMTLAIVAAVAISLSIEIGQVLFAGRYPSLVDLFLNVAGAAIGWRFGVALVRQPVRSPESSRHD